MEFFFAKHKVLPSHASGQCPAKNLVCFYCKKKGHIESWNGKTLCFAKKNSTNQQDKPRKQMKATTYEEKEEDSSETSE